MSRYDYVDDSVREHSWCLEQYTKIIVNDPYPTSKASMILGERTYNKAEAIRQFCEEHNLVFKEEQLF